MNVDEMARRIRPVVAQMPMNRVLAVWADGSITDEVFSFVERAAPQGGRIRPVATFVGGLQLSHSEMVERLDRGLERGYGQAAG
jgi:hypothetical protein